jgi:hypothetical protein
MMRSFRTLASTVSTATLLSLLLTGPVQAQRVHGRSLDKLTGEPVAQTRLHLVRIGGDTIRGLTNDHGAYSVALAPGRYRIVAERIGYARIETPVFELRDKEQLQLDILLPPGGMTLDPITVVGESGFEPGRFAFERRCATSGSRCLDRDSLDLRDARYAADLFRGIDGIMIKFNPQSGRSYIRSFQCLTVFLNHMTRPVLSSGYSTFRPRDPHPAPDYLNVLDPEDVVGIELYRDRSEVPKELLGGLRMLDTFGCGVGIIWTRAAW